MFLLDYWKYLYIYSDFHFSGHFFSGFVYLAALFFSKNILTYLRKIYFWKIKVIKTQIITYIVTNNAIE